MSALTVYDPCGNILLRIHGIDHETITGVDRIYTAQIGNNHLSVYFCMRLDHFFELFCLLKVYFDTFLHVRQI